MVPSAIGGICSRPSVLPFHSGLTDQHSVFLCRSSFVLVRLPVAFFRQPLVFFTNANVSRQRTFLESLSPSNLVVPVYIPIPVPFPFQEKG